MHVSCKISRKEKALNQHAACGTVKNFRNASPLYLSVMLIKNP